MMSNPAFLALALAVAPAVHATDASAVSKSEASVPEVRTGSDRIRIQRGMTAEQIVAMMRAKGYRDAASTAPLEVAMAEPGNSAPAAMGDRIRIQQGMTADQVEAMMRDKGYRSEPAMDVPAAGAQPLVD